MHATIIPKIAPHITSNSLWPTFSFICKLNCLFNTSACLPHSYMSEKIVPKSIYRKGD